MIEQVLYYFKENSKLASDYNLKILTFLGCLSLNIDYDFTFKDKELVLDIIPQEKEFTKDEEFKLFCINKAIGHIDIIDGLVGFLAMFYEQGDSFTSNTKKLRPYFEDFFNEYERSFKNYTYNRVVYYNKNVFYIHFDEELTSEEIDYLNSVKDSEVNHFEVFKDEQGRIELF